ncbi:hypothetical protein [Desulfopila sp. IMCC35008]|uniref:hypothetical protein n=1 Tax=Desulfopila sp. IMCC35008 TaxID=2653858 RepID=UPI0013D7897C|nr:hypothetical protein [Desulfopila sp. IMCC35008]
MRWSWWFSVLLSILSYTGLKYGLPLIAGEDVLPEDFLKMLAPLTAMGFLLLAAKQLYDIPSIEGEYPDEKENPAENNGESNPTDTD